MIGRARAERPSGTADAGFSYVEIVTAVAVLAIMLVPMSRAFAMVISDSSKASKHVAAMGVLQSAADRINRAPLSCEYDSYAQAAGSTAGWPTVNTSVVEERYSADANGVVTWLPGGCPPAGVNDTLVQLVTITMIDPATNYSRTLQVVKSSV